MTTTELDQQSVQNELDAHRAHHVRGVLWSVAGHLVEKRRNKLGPKKSPQEVVLFIQHVFHRKVIDGD